MTAATLPHRLHHLAPDLTQALLHDELLSLLALPSALLLALALAALLIPGPRCACGRRVTRAQAQCLGCALTHLEVD